MHTEKVQVKDIKECHESLLRYYVSPETELAAIADKIAEQQNIASKLGMLVSTQSIETPDMTVQSFTDSGFSILSKMTK